MERGCLGWCDERGVVGYVRRGGVEGSPCQGVVVVGGGGIVGEILGRQLVLRR